MIREKGIQPNPSMRIPIPTTSGPSVQYVIFTLMNQRVRIKIKYADSAMYAAISLVFGKKKNGGSTIMEIQSANIESFSMADRIVSAIQGPFGKKIAQRRGRAATIDAQNRNFLKLSIPVFINQL